MAGEDLPVVFHVLADFQDACVFKHGLQGRKRFGKGQLTFGQCGGTEQVAAPGGVTKRDIGGFACVNTQGNADQIGAHFVKAGGFGIDGHMPDVADMGDPAVQRVHVADAFIGGVVEGQAVHRGFGFDMGPLHLQRAGFGQGGGGKAKLVGDALGQGAEFHRRKKTHDRVGIGQFHGQVVKADVQRCVGFQRDQIAGNADQVGVVLQGLAALGLLDFTGAGQKGIKVTIFVDQKRGGLQANARRAGDVVGAVTGKGLNINHFIRGNAEFLHHLIRADRLGFHRIEHVDSRSDQLHQVLVGGDDGAASPGLNRMAGKGGDDVVGLVPRGLDAGDVEGAGGVAGQGELRTQVFGRFGALGLVKGVDFVAEGL